MKLAAHIASAYYSHPSAVRYEVNLTPTEKFGKDEYYHRKVYGLSPTLTPGGGGGYLWGAYARYQNKKTPLKH